MNVGQQTDVLFVSDESGTVTPIEQISDLSDSDSSIVDDAVIVVKVRSVMHSSNLCCN